MYSTCLAGNYFPARNSCAQREGNCRITLQPALGLQGSVFVALLLRLATAATSCSSRCLTLWYGVKQGDFLIEVTESVTNQVTSIIELCLPSFIKVAVLYCNSKAAWW